MPKAFAFRSEVSMVQGSLTLRDESMSRTVGEGKRDDPMYSRHSVLEKYYICMINWNKMIY